MSKLITVLNGPNLNLLGQREPDIYGHETLEDVAQLCRAVAGKHGADVDFKQSNSEGQLVDWVHQARGEAAGIVINPAAYTHTSVALLDALHAFTGPVIEVHLSNVHKRESFRAHSYVSLRADGIIVGCGTQGYELALLRVLRLIRAD